MGIATTRLSSKGQIVLPAWVRKKLRLVPGDVLQIDVDEGKRVIVLKSRDPRDLERLLEIGSEWFRKTGRDLVEELHAARRAERARERRRRP